MPPRHHHHYHRYYLQYYPWRNRQLNTSYSRALLPPPLLLLLKRNKHTSTSSQPSSIHLNKKSTLLLSLTAITAATTTLLYKHKEEEEEEEKEKEIPQTLLSIPLMSRRSQQKHLDITLLTTDQLNNRLREKQHSVLSNKTNQNQNTRTTTTKKPSSISIPRWDVCQVNSNEPVEDSHSQIAVDFRRKEEGRKDARDVASPERYFFGVFDGHSGWHCSRKVAVELPIICASTIYESTHEPEKSTTDTIDLPTSTNLDLVEATKRSLTQAFLRLDDEIVKGSLAAAAKEPTKARDILLPAVSGACALLAYVDLPNRDLYVAWAGDSRAVLGRETNAGGRGMIEAVDLSNDQTGRDPAEIERIRSEHPGEEATAVWRGRVLGNLEPSRSFGDARYKWDVKTNKTIFDTYFQRDIPKNYLTPPYVTANPGITHHKLKSDDKFIVLATDGLYDKLTSEEVVALVTGWMRRRRQQDNNPSVPYLPKLTTPPPVSEISGGVKAPHHPNVSLTNTTTTTSNTNTNATTLEENPPPRLRWTYVDTDNVATHLIRNAFGGADEEEVRRMLSIPAPHSRRFRDDVTVTVVFFANDDDVDVVDRASPDTRASKAKGDQRRTYVKTLVFGPGSGEVTESVSLPTSKL